MKIVSLIFMSFCYLSTQSQTNSVNRIQLLEEYNSEANRLVTSEDYVGAISVYNKALEIFPYDANILYNRGLAKHKLQDFRGAIKDYTQSLDLDPNKIDGFINRADSKFSIKDYQGAIDDYDKVLKSMPDNSKIYHNRGVAKIFLNQKEEGCMDLSKAGELGYTFSYEAIKGLCN